MTPDARALCDTLRAAIVRTGWSRTAELAGVDRCNLHRAFRPSRYRHTLPSFTTIASVAEAVGLELVARPRESSLAAGPSRPTEAGC